jgi:hypothetical protein
MTDIESIIRTVVREELERVIEQLPAGTPSDDEVRPGRPWRGEHPAVDGLGGEILAQLARRRQTQARLAEQTGIPIATLSRRLRDSSSFRVGELRRIADELGVDLRELVLL